MVAAPRPAIRSGRLAGMATAPVLAVPSLSVRTVALYGAVTSHSIRGPSARTGDRLLRPRGPSLGRRLRAWTKTQGRLETFSLPLGTVATVIERPITGQRMGGIAGRPSRISAS